MSSQWKFYGSEGVLWKMSCFSEKALERKCELWGERSVWKLNCLSVLSENIFLFQLKQKLMKYGRDT